MVVSVPEPADALSQAPPRRAFSGLRPGASHTIGTCNWREKWNPPQTACPATSLIVEDDPIIALDFEDTLLGFGVKTVRTAGSVAKALFMIEKRPPILALLDVSLIRENSFAVAERWTA
jgi:hypothetical protein